MALGPGGVAGVQGVRRGVVRGAWGNGRRRRRGLRGGEWRGGEWGEG